MTFCFQPFSLLVSLLSGYYFIHVCCNRTVAVDSLCSYFHASLSIKNKPNCYFDSLIHEILLTDINYFT